MTQTPLISIIIPTYNRAYLINETLDSIIAQSYTNWECLVIDDGSTDNTQTLLKTYCKKDDRIKYFERPDSMRKGANACRNYGFELSKGTYVNWFDSDDIMYSGFLEVKVDSLLKNADKDFVVTRGVNFYEDGSTKELSIRNNKTKKLDHNNFIQFEVFWITHDFFVKKDRVGTVRFDETIKSGQEYNFFIKVLAINQLKGFFVNKILFKRRWHKKSIQGKFNGDDDTFCLDQYMLYKNTFRDTSKYLNSEARAYMFRRLASRSFELKRRKLNTPQLKEVLDIYKSEKKLFKTLLFKLSLFLGYHTGKGYVLMDISRK